MDKRLRNIWWAFLGILLVIAVLKFLLPVKSAVSLEDSERMDEMQSGREIVIYITGAVDYTGLLHLPLDARLDDALKKAQLHADADINALNPAQKLKDGQKVIIPFKALSGELGASSQGSFVYVEESKSNAVPRQSETGSYGSTIVRVNINTAGTAELDSIPGIGPALAQRIVDYRVQNGLFSTPEEIQQVAGIGPKTFEKMVLYITVGP